MEVLQRLTRRQLEALEAIHSGERPERGVPLGEVAKALHVSAPAALAHLTVIEDMGLIVRHRGKTKVSPKGLRTLVEYRRHHRVAEALFGQVGLSAADACAAAYEIDLALSHRTIDRICAATGHPDACPHGEPIPACAGDGGRHS